jgi:hypothetical protein
MTVDPIAGLEKILWAHWNLSQGYTSGITRVHHAGCSKRPFSKAAADGSTGGVAPGYVEDAFEARTMLADFFSILLGFFLPEEERAIQSRDGNGDEFDRQQQSAHDGIRCGRR